MTLQELIDLHKPQSLADCDALVKGNYFHHEVERSYWSHGSLLLGYKYTVKTGKGLFKKKQVAYISGLIQ